MTEPIGTKPVHIANRRRLWLLSGSALLLAAVVAGTVIDADDRGYRLYMGLNVLILIYGAVRAPRLGAWLTPDGVAVRSWVRTRRFAWPDVHGFQTSAMGSRRFPSLVRTSGAIVPVPGLERGFFHELHTTAWEADLAQANQVMRLLTSRWPRSIRQNGPATDR